MTACVFTITRDEPIFLPLWINHYRKFFNAADVWLLKHGGWTGDWPVNEIPVHHPVGFDHRWLCETVRAFQAFLLKSYDNVLFAEVDEFVVTDPLDRKDLGEVCRSNPFPQVRVSGINVVEAAGERPLNWSKPIMAQRSVGFRDPMYDKVLLAREPTPWTVGFHTATGVAAADAGLTMLHLHRVDYAYCLERHRTAAAMKWPEEDLKRGYGRQNRVTGAAEFEGWYYGPDRGVCPLDLSRFRNAF